MSGPDPGRRSRAGTQEAASAPDDGVGSSTALFCAGMVVTLPTSATSTTHHMTCTRVDLPTIQAYQTQAIAILGGGVVHAHARSKR